MFNFENYSVSLKNNGSFEIKNDKEFKNLREETGKKALEVVNSQKGAIEKNIKIIKEYL